MDKYTLSIKQIEDKIAIIVKKNLGLKNINIEKIIKSISQNILELKIISKELAKLEISAELHEYLDKVLKYAEDIKDYYSSGRYLEKISPENLNKAKKEYEIYFKNETKYKINKIRNKLGWINKYEYIYNSITFFPGNNNNLIWTPSTSKMIHHMYNLLFNPTGVVCKNINDSVQLCIIDKKYLQDENFNSFIKDHSEYDTKYVVNRELNDLRKHNKEKGIYELTNKKLEELLKKRYDDAEKGKTIDKYYISPKYVSCKNIIWGKLDNPLYYNRNEHNKFDDLGDNLLSYLFVTLDEQSLEEKILKKESIGHNQRQYVYGMYEDVVQYRNIPKYFRCYNMDNVTITDSYFNSTKHSPVVNSLFTKCAIDSTNLLFPIRLIVKSQSYIPKRMKPYHAWYKDSITSVFKNSTYIGIYTLSILVNKKERKQYYFIFYDKDEQIYKIYDFMANVKYPGFFSGLPTITFIELSQLCDYYNLVSFQHINKTNTILFCKKENESKIPKYLLNYLRKVTCYKDVRRSRNLQSFVGSKEIDFRYSNSGMSVSFQVGGDNDFYLENKIKFFNDKISSPYFNEFINAQINILKKVDNNYSRYMDILINVNPYEYLKPLSYKFFINKNVDIKHNFTGYSISQYLKNKEYKSILYYEPLDVITLYLWELYYNTTFLSNNKINSVKVLSISNWNFASEVCYILRQKYGTNPDDTFDITLLSYLNNDSLYQRNMIKSLGTKVNNQKILDYDKLDINKLKKFDEYDLVYNNIDIRDAKTGYWEYYISKHAKMVYLLVSMLKLSKNGTLIFVIGNILNDIDIDMIQLIHESFKTYKIVRPEIQIAEKQGGFYIIAKKMNIHKENIIAYLDIIYKNDIKLGSIWKAPMNNNSPISINTMIYKLEKSSNFKYWRIRTKNKIRDEIIKNVLILNKKYFIEGLHTLSKMEEFIESSFQNKKYQMYYCLNWSQRFEWKLKTNIISEPFVDSIDKKILQDMFSYDKGIEFKFKKYSSQTKIVLSQNKLPLYFEKLTQDINMSSLVIDTRNPDIYERVKKLVKLYQTSLGFYLKSIGIDVDGINVSRAWTKMYEILTVIPDILPTKKTIKSFHLCEAPGGFIHSMQYYAQKKNSILDWKAESLNPKHPINIKKYGSVFGDGFGLMKKYPDRWIWGEDGTGDITNSGNIKSYHEHCKNIDIITSDCGVKSNQTNPMMNKINYAQFLFIFNNLPSGSNCILKVFSPLNSQKISLLYLLYLQFNTLYFYKPMQNPSSLEFYVIGIKYKLLEQENLDKMFNLLENYDNDTSIISNIPKTFYTQLEKIMKTLADNYDRSIQKKIYYVDNFDALSKKKIKELKQIIIDKNEDWAKIVGLHENFSDT